MSNRAKEASVIAYPQKDKLNKKGTGHYDPNFQRRKAYQQGYEQAEKDMVVRLWDWLRIGRGRYSFEEFKKEMEVE